MSGVGDALHQCVRQACLLWYDEVGNGMAWCSAIWRAWVSDRIWGNSHPGVLDGRIWLTQFLWNEMYGMHWARTWYCEYQMNRNEQKGYHGRLWASEVGQIFLHHLDVYPKLISTDILIHHTHSIYSKFPLANILNWSRQLSYLHIQEREKYE